MLVEISKVSPLESMPAILRSLAPPAFKDFEPPHRSARIKRPGTADGVEGGVRRLSQRWDRASH